jgi:type IV pilus assembly protein PilC
VLFEYKARSTDGNELKGTIEASDQQAALEILEAKDLWVSSVTEVDQKWSLQTDINLFSYIPASLFNAFLLQLAVMIKSGVTLLDALASLENGETNRSLKYVLGELRKDIEKGNSFSDALSNHPKVFSSFFVNMIRIGEAGGVLEQVLVKLASVNQRSVSLRNQILGALAYPCLLIFVTSCVLAILFGFALPRFAKMFQSANFPLPMPTKIVLSIGTFVEAHFVLLIGLGIALTIIGILAILTRTGRWIAGEVTLRIPVFKSVVKSYLVVHISESLSLLLAAGVPLLELLSAIEATLDMPTAKQTLVSMRTFVERGNTMRLALEGNQIFSPMALKLIETGEKTGNLDQMFEEIANYYDTVLQSSIKAALSVIEPLLIFFLAGVVGGIMLAVILPIFQMSQLFKGGAG